MNNKKNLRRRYFLTKTRKVRNKTKMNDDEVATDYKLQQFLADVEKFSERNKMRKEEKSSSKQAPLGKSTLPNEKRGLFENGMLSKPSVKGLLGLKNKARLAGDLKDLLKDDASKNQMISPSSSECSKDMPPSVVYRDVRASTSSEKPGNEQPDKLSDWWKSYTDMHNITKEEKKGKLKDEGHKSSKETEVIDEAITFAEKKALEFRQQVHDTVKDYGKRFGPFIDIIDELQQKLVKDMEQRILKKLMKNDPDILKEVKRIQEQFFQTKKPEMVDKCSQTDFILDISSKTNHTFDKIEFTPDKREKNFVFTVPTTGQPQTSFIPENLPIPTSDCPQGSFIYDNSAPLEPTNFFESLPGPSGINKKKDQFDFLPKDSSRNLHFLSPPRGATSPFFEKTTPEMRPPVLDQCWAPSMKNPEKPYFPIILSPLSPGRKYSNSPKFLEEPQWNHFKKPLDPNVLRGNFKRNSFPDLTTGTSEDLKTASNGSFPFPKRLRVTFSPHRL